MNLVRKRAGFFWLALVFIFFPAKFLEANPVNSDLTSIIKVITEGKTVFTDKELEAIIADFLGKPINLENVQLIAHRSPILNQVIKIATRFRCFP